jgi:hypothetical protein
MPFDNDLKISVNATDSATSLRYSLVNISDHIRLAPYTTL